MRMKRERWEMVIGDGGWRGLGCLSVWYRLAAVGRRSCVTNAMHFLWGVLYVHIRVSGTRGKEGGKE